MKIVSVYDKKTDVYSQPWAEKTEVHAYRSFQGAVNTADSNNMLYNYPEDHDLYILADFDETTGAITPNKKLLATGTAVKKETK